MARLEDLQRGAQVRGIVPDQIVTLTSVDWHGPNALEVIFRRADGGLGSQLLYRNDQPRLELAAARHTWTFDTPGDLFKLVSEAYRIRLAHLFDERLAVHTSLIEPLPHQITAVYDHMLNRQPLRFLLADDPGAGKTIMAGLLVRELIARGDVRRCLVCAPGNLTEQWQDELWSKFQLDFTLLARESVETSRSGNPFAEHDLVIARLDQLSRSPDLQARLAQTEWDLVIRYLWRGQPHVKVSQLWDDLARYCYLPRLASEDVLIEAIRDGLNRAVDEPFAYAERVDADGRYRGLTWHQPAARIYNNGDDVLVHPDAARRQETEEAVKQTTVNGITTAYQTTRSASGATSASPSATPSAPTEPAPALTTRYYGTVRIDPRRANREVASVVEEIIQRLTSQPGTEVEITLEIHASRMLGFDEATVRTLDENSRALKFRSHGFETD